jgi:hypothetical protein
MSGVDQEGEQPLLRQLGFHLLHAIKSNADIPLYFAYRLQ